MPVDIDIAKVAKLARIALSPEELARYGAQLGGILEHAAVVQALSTEGVPPTSHPLPMVNTFRPDVAREAAAVERDEVLSQAPATEDGYFRVPRILEEE
jgi:aspartyl-tRNA(Asn)/glutamyl-tRNA(Gln) amidotransferase subunit C